MGDRLVLGARALRSGKPGFEKRGRIQAMRTMLAQFASREEAGIQVTLDIEVHGAITSYEGQTDSEGFVHFHLELDPPLDPRLIGVAWRTGRNLPPAARRFVEIAHDVAREIAESLVPV